MWHHRQFPGEAIVAVEAVLGSGTAEVQGPPSFVARGTKAQETGEESQRSSVKRYSTAKLF